MIRVRNALSAFEEREMAPLVRRFEMTARWADETFIPRAYGTAEEGFESALEAEGVSESTPWLWELSPYVAATAAAGAVCQFDSDSSRAVPRLIHCDGSTPPASRSTIVTNDGRSRVPVLRPYIYSGA